VLAKPLAPSFSKICRLNQVSSQTQRLDYLASLGAHESTDFTTNLHLQRSGLHRQHRPTTISGVDGHPTATTNARINSSEPARPPCRPDRHHRLPLGHDTLVGDPIPGLIAEDLSSKHWIFRQRAVPGVRALGL